MNKKLTLLSTAMLSATSLFAADKNPNIILILADDMRGTAMDFLGVEDIHTPNLDKLAAESTVFTNAHIMGGTSGAVSMPSRAMLMTGKYLYTLEKQGATVPEDHKLIGETLQQSGYNSFHTGKWHNGYQAMNRCFNDGKGIYFGGMWDHWNVPLYDYNADCDYSNKRPVVKDWAKSNVITYEKGEYMLSGKHSVDIFTEDAVEYIEKQKEAGKPFFLSVAYMSPHDPRTMPDEYMRQYDFDNIQLPPNYMDKHPFDNGELVIRDEVLAAIPRVPDEIKKHIMEYYAMVTHVDHRVGDIVKALKETGEYENTIIVFAGDNGLAVGQHGLMGKQNVYEHSVRVPLMIKQAGKDVKGQKSDKLCYLIDVFPTLCEMVGANIPSSVDGVSLVPAIKEDKPVRDYLYYSYMDNQRAVSDGEWKLCEYNVKGVRTTQLFNLKADPWEMNNLAGEKKHAKLIKKLRNQMTLEQEKTKDNSSFWNGFVF